MKKIFVVFGMMLGLSSFVASSVHAAQSAKVVSDSASVYEKPTGDSSVVGTVTKDTTIAVSNLVTNGFYKARISSGKIGWISEKDVLIGAAPGSSSEAEPAAPARSGKRQKDSSEGDHSRIMISGGIQSLNNGGYPAVIPITGSKLGYGATLEMQFKLSSSFYWAARAEYFMSSSAQVVSASTTQTLKFHTLPVMVGVVATPLTSQDFRLGIGAYAGISLLTSMAVTQTTVLNSISVSYTSSDLCGYVNLQPAYALSPGIGIFGEAGYRFHSSAYPASTTIAGATTFKADYGGLVARLGVEFKL